MKRYYRIKWDNNSKIDNRNEVQEKIKVIKSDFSQKDWEYLIDNAPNAQIKHFLKQQMQEHVQS